MGLTQVCERMKGPTFVAIAAGTGSGKTVAGLRALTALTDNQLRFTLPMNQRGLTSQSMKAMCEDGRVPRNSMVTAIGHPQTVGLDDAHDAMIQQHESNQELAGSESALGAEDTLEMFAAEGDSFAKPVQQDHSWLAGLGNEAYLTKLFGNKTLQMLSTPVLGCTADHLVGAVELLRGGDARVFLRLTTSDLILDEIDSYQGTDQQSINKLAFLAGVGGRHVVVMSASMSPPVSNGLFRAWKDGIDLRNSWRLGHGVATRYGVVLAVAWISRKIVDCRCQANLQ